MGLFNRHAYPAGAHMQRRSGVKTLLLVLGVVFGLYFLNMAFLWIKLPVISATTLRLINIVTGILLIIFGLMTLVRPRY